jgi:hypothetical protein
MSAQTSTSPFRPVGSKGNLFHGFLEPTEGSIDIVKHLCDAIHSSRGFLPQKYLYTSLTGANLWKNLSEGDSHVAEVYRNFPLPDHLNELAQELNKRTGQMLDNSPDKALGLIALGAGTGAKELKVCQQLLRHPQLSRLDTLVADMSSDLVSVALRKFKKILPNNRVSHQFAVMDIESGSGLAHLRELRAKVANQPFVFLLLGNTLGVIDEEQFLARMSDVMLPHDLILCEVSLADEKDTDGPRTEETAYKPEADFDRAQFVCDPLRALGINPQIANLKQIIERELGKWVRHEFYYRFDANEAQLNLSVDPKPTIRQNSRVGLTELKRMTKTHALRVFQEVFSDVSITEHEYEAVSHGAGKIRMAYVFASAPGSQPRIKFHESDLTNLCFEIAGMKCKLSPTHYAFVRFLGDECAKPNSEAARNFVIDWLESFLEKGGNMAPNQKGLLERLKNARSEEKKIERRFEAISNLKSDARDGLKNSKKRKGDELAAAQKLLAMWPEEEDWKLKPLTS